MKVDTIFICKRVVHQLCWSQRAMKSSLLLFYYYFLSFLTRTQFQEHFLYRSLPLYFHSCRVLFCFNILPSFIIWTWEFQRVSPSPPPPPPPDIRSIQRHPSTLTERRNGTSVSSLGKFLSAQTENDCLPFAFNPSRGGDPQAGW